MPIFSITLMSNKSLLTISPQVLFGFTLLLILTSSGSSYHRLGFISSLNHTTYLILSFFVNPFIYLSIASQLHAFCFLAMTLLHNI